MVRKILPMLLVLIGLSLAGCGEYGDVEQGRVVKFDSSTTPATVWIIKDSGTDDKHPRYDVLPAHQFTLPTDPNEIGPLPAVGLRVNLNVTDKIITMYNLETQQFEKIPFELLNNDLNVSVRKRHPLVWDASARKERKFPEVNEAERTIKIYSRRQEMLSEIRLSAEDFARFGPQDWDAGDEVRIYFREPGKALRFMNVTRTDFSKK